MQVIVDGNNVFRALRLDSAGGTADSETFLQQLELAAVERDWEITVIFDGRERYLPRETGPLTVCYSGSKQTADSLIERMAYQAQERSEVIVVTQDRAVGDLIVGLGAFVWSPARLRETLDA